MYKKSIGFEIKEINDLIIKKMMRSAHCENRKMISHTQAKIIEYLCENKTDVYQKDIEKTLNLKRSTISGILDTMEKNDLISRLSDKTDLRLKKIVLTPYAILKLNEIKTKIEKINDALGKNVSNEDLEVFYRVTNQIKLNIINEED